MPAFNVRIQFVVLWSKMFENRLNMLYIRLKSNWIQSAHFLRATRFLDDCGWATIANKY